MESQQQDQFWLEVGRASHQLELDHGHKAHSYAAKLAIEAEADGREEDARFWKAVSSALNAR